ncbi:ThuA domain-containing protein [Paenibacillus soyae]|uniref:ThuA domain-containing protein n=1 Tax=Paenibacillus soyae TaxID=2969249 RepID=A0A9X2MR83_9BACL|nr:ThuA domain-containing protein [Paenibacillus soyae]MCR2802407.1 ThuA domain-containing protein [Paenibacillus soyae]
MGKHLIWAYVGDFYHKAEWAKAALEGALAVSIADGSVELRFAGDTEEFVAGLREKPAAAVLFAENRTDPERMHDKVWMTGKHAADIVRYVEGGGGWLAWHSGLASYPEEGEYAAMLKGYFLSHPSEHQLVRYTPAGSPGLAAEAFELMDEHYFVECREAETDVFLRSESVDGSSIAGWRHASGAGRVCCLTPAHREDGLADGTFRSLLQASVCWTSKIMD